MKENAAVARHWLADGLTLPERTAVQEIAPGQAAIVRIAGRKIGIHREDDGTLHAVSATCTHLACLLHWNEAERSWDCPCHGSRFATDGMVLQGPAVRDLTRFDLPELRRVEAEKS